MKKQLRLLSIVAALLLVAGVAFAANGDSINIGGQVPLILDLTVVPDAAADNLTLVGAAATVNPTIATITIATNNTLGWELWVFSTDLDGTSSLINADGDQIDYTISYAGAGTQPTATIPAIGLQVGAEGDATGDTAALSITYDLATTYPAGYYSDSLTIVLRAQ